ncbi:MAG: hypothetical protein AAGU74_06910 [Bacillota bacterium]
MRRSRAKRKINVFRFAVFIGLTLAAIAGVVFGALKLFGNAGARAELDALPFTAQEPYVYTGAGFLYLQGGTVNYKDLSDEGKDYSLSVAQQDIRLAGGTNIAAVYSAAAMQIVSATTPVEFSGAIEQVRCGVSHAAALVNDAAGKASLLVYDNTGKLLDELTFADQYLVSFGFFGSAGDTLWTLEMDACGEIPCSTIKTYDIDRMTTTGVLPIQNQLVSDVVMTQSSTFVVGTNHLIRFSRTGNTEAYRLLIYGYTLLDYSVASAPSFLFKPRGEADLSLVRLYTVSEGDAAAQTARDFTLPADTLGAFLCGGNVAAVTPDKICLYKSDATPLKTIELEGVAQKAYKLDASKLLIESGGQLSIISVG